MIIDLNNIMSDRQNLAQAAGSYLSSAYDSGPASTDQFGATVKGDLSKVKALELLAQVVEDFTSGGAATLTVELIHSDNADLSSYVTLQTTAAIALATLKKGYRFRLNLQPGMTKRYVGLRYTIGTAAMTAGKVTAALLLGADNAPGNFS